MREYFVRLLCERLNDFEVLSYSGYISDVYFAEQELSLFLIGATSGYNGDTNLSNRASIILDRLRMRKESEIRCINGVYR